MIVHVLIKSSIVCFVWFESVLVNTSIHVRFNRGKVFVELHHICNTENKGIMLALEC